MFYLFIVTYSYSIFVNIKACLFSVIPITKCSRPLNEPPHEKTKNLHRRKQSGNCTADQRLCFRYKDSTILHLPSSF